MLGPSLINQPVSRTWQYVKKMDILALTETWLSPHDITSCISDICPPDYSFYHQPHHSGRGVLVFAFYYPITLK